MLLIGSRALALTAPYLLNRNPKDFDFVCTMDEFNSWLDQNKPKLGDNVEVYPLDDGAKMIAKGNVPCEFEIIRQGESSEMLADIVAKDPETKHTKFGMVPSLDVLYTLKKSHRYLKDSPHFWKNLHDYHRMKKAGATTKPEHQQFLKLREKETYKNRTPKLKSVSKKDFFNPDSGVSYVYDHDSIHVAVKHLDKPAYRFFMKDGAEVECDKEKFFSCPRNVQLLSVLEESYVLALERSQIPFADKNIPPIESFRIAFSKVLTSITSGWWREFAYENAFDVLKMYSNDYKARFDAGLASGIVKPFNGDNNPYK